jgi:bifunctional non-homologous end joining protein LigD
VHYPETGLTKRGLGRILRRDRRLDPAASPIPSDDARPLSRRPRRRCFYQKHTGYWAPASLRRAHIEEKHKTGQYLVIDDLAGLVGLVQIGILEIHVWNTTRRAPSRSPTRVVFDLDPGDGRPMAPPWWQRRAWYVRACRPTGSRAS